MPDLDTIWQSKISSLLKALQLLWEAGRGREGRGEGQGEGQGEGRGRERRGAGEGEGQGKGRDRKRGKDGTIVQRTKQYLCTKSCNTVEPLLEDNPEIRQPLY